MDYQDENETMLYIIERQQDSIKKISKQVNTMQRTVNELKTIPTDIATSAGNAFRADFNDWLNTEALRNVKIAISELDAAKRETQNVWSFEYEHVRKLNEKSKEIYQHALHLTTANIIATSIIISAFAAHYGYVYGKTILFLCAILLVPAIAILRFWYVHKKIFSSD